MHRNTYLPSPTLLNADYSLRSRPSLYFAGQMTGVEGYIESTGSGFVAGVNAARQAKGLDRILFPEESMIGAMAAYVSRGGLGDFVPMNANFGIIPPLDHRVPGGKVARYEQLAERSLKHIHGMMAEKF